MVKSNFLLAPFYDGSRHVYLFLRTITTPPPHYKTHSIITNVCIVCYS